jgi:hypothetical protein
VIICIRVGGCIGAQDRKVRPLLSHFTLNVTINPFSFGFAYITHSLQFLVVSPFWSTSYLSDTLTLIIATIASRVNLSRQSHSLLPLWTPTSLPPNRHTPPPRLLSRHARWGRTATAADTTPAPLNGTAFERWEKLRGCSRSSCVRLSVEEGEVGSHGVVREEDLRWNGRGCQRRQRSVSKGVKGRAESRNNCPDEWRRLAKGIRSVGDGGNEPGYATYASSRLGLSPFTVLISLVGGAAGLGARARSTRDGTMMELGRGTTMILGLYLRI